MSLFQRPIVKTSVDLKNIQNRFKNGEINSESLWKMYLKDKVLSSEDLINTLLDCTNVCRTTCGPSLMSIKNVAF